MATCRSLLMVIHRICCGTIQIPMSISILSLFSLKVFKILIMLPNQTWGRFGARVNLWSITPSKANLLTQGCGEGKHRIYFKAPCKKSSTASAQNLEPLGLQESIFKGQGEGVGHVISSCNSSKKCQFLEKEPKHNQIRRYYIHHIVGHLKSNLYDHWCEK